MKALLCFCHENENFSYSVCPGGDLLVHSLTGFKGSNCLGPGHGGPEPDKAEKLCKALNVWGKSPGAGSVGDLVG